MVLAAQVQCLANLPVTPELLCDLAPQWDGREHRHVSNAEQALFRPRQSHTNTVRYTQETHLPFLIASNQGQYYYIILLSLVSIYNRQFNITKRFLIHNLFQAKELTVVCGKNCNLGRIIPLTDKVIAESLDKGGLVLVLVTSAFRDVLFKVLMFHKEDI